MIGAAISALAKRALAFVGLGNVSPLLLIAGVLAGLSIAGGLVTTGYNWASSKCEAAALRAKLDAVTIERDAVNTRLADAAKRLIQAQTIDRKNADEIAQLNELVGKLKSQSTQPGAKHDPNALYDDECNYTPLGARRLH